ncbi:hypothetical protein [Roseibium alexandrii]|uniref:Uncharacterized protein n=1 Tax=Roseibium alexandrii (strain DSM 17067 / NCIMB 14079 / DFL-11) TaxID=244592 RepID=A0A5E8H0P8_ROSAD|nr:hypothetical protein [Roseibium alexandrii]EEE45487.1 hypothetical protein SADFL11_2776 [Roseibium alexandrii DFL-11]
MVEFFNTRLARFIGWVFGFAGIIATYISGWSLLEIFVGEQNAVSVWPTIYVLFLTLIIILFAIFRQLQTMRKEKYANITGYLHSISHQLRDLETYIDEWGPKEHASIDQYEMFLEHVREKFCSILDQMSVTFTSLTGTRCRSCIKLIYSLVSDDGEQKLYFYTFQRDTASARSLHDHDQKRITANHDPHEKNPQFAAICDDASPDRWHFFSNDLLKEDNFKTTSMTAYDSQYGNRWKYSIFNFLNGRGWPLPYKSCLTCVIRQGPTVSGQVRPETVIGFLSVDSESRNVFKETWDKEIVFSVADALYWPLRKILTVQQVAETLKSNPPG